MMKLGRHNCNVISIFDLITISFTFTLKPTSWCKAILYDRFSHLNPRPIVTMAVILIIHRLRQKFSAAADIMAMCQKEEKSSNSYEKFCPFYFENGFNSNLLLVLRRPCVPEGLEKSDISNLGNKLCVLAT